MRPTRTAVAAFFGAAAIGLSAPVAAAVDSPVGSVSPGSVRPDSTVHLTLENCDDQSARADGGGAFGPTNLAAKEPGTFEGSATVFSDAKPGAEYEVKFWCGSRPDGAASVTIADGSPGEPSGRPSDRPTHHDPKDRPSHDPAHEPTRPSHGTRGGEGGSIAGMSTTTAVAGAGLLAAAAGGGVYAMRRRARSSGGN